MPSPSTSPAVSPAMTYTVRPATAPDLAAIGAINVAALIHDPLYRYRFPHAEAHRDEFEAFARDRFRGIVDPSSSTVPESTRRQKWYKDTEARMVVVTCRGRRGDLLASSSVGGEGEQQDRDPVEKLLVAGGVVGAGKAEAEAEADDDVVELVVGFSTWIIPRREVEEEKEEGEKGDGSATKPEEQQQQQGSTTTTTTTTTPSSSSASAAAAAAAPVAAAPPAQPLRPYEDPARVAAVSREIAAATERLFNDAYSIRGHAHLGMLACHPRYQRLGLGGKLLVEGLEEVRRRRGDGRKEDIRAVTLWASDKGAGLYRRHGFRDVGEFRTQVEGEEEFVDTKGMVLDLM